MWFGIYKKIVKLSKQTDLINRSKAKQRSDHPRRSRSSKRDSSFSRGSTESVASRGNVSKHGWKGLFRLYLKIRVAPFLLTRLIAPGSPCMSSEEKCFKVRNPNPVKASISAALVNHNASRTTT